MRRLEITHDELENGTIPVATRLEGAGFDLRKSIRKTEDYSRCVLIYTQKEETTNE